MCRNIAPEVVLCKKGSIRRGIQEGKKTYQIRMNIMVRSNQAFCSGKDCKVFCSLASESSDKRNDYHYQWKEIKKEETIASRNVALATRSDRANTCVGL